MFYQVLQTVMHCCYQYLSNVKFYIFPEITFSENFYIDWDGLTVVKENHKEKSLERTQFFRRKSNVTSLPLGAGSFFLVNRK